MQRALLLTLGIYPEAAPSRTVVKEKIREIREDAGLPKHSLSSELRR